MTSYIHPCIEFWSHGKENLSGVYKCDASSRSPFMWQYMKLMAEIEVIEHKFTAGIPTVDPMVNLIAIWSAFMKKSEVASISPANEASNKLVSIQGCLQICCLIYTLSVINLREKFSKLFTIEKHAYHRQKYAYSTSHLLK